MNRLLKFINCMLATVMVLSCIAVPSFAAAAPKNPDVLLKALEIIDGTEAEKAEEGRMLSRAAAIYYALKVTGHEILPAKTYSFTDVTSDTEYADAIESGFGVGMISPAEGYRPEADVTFAEFVSMITRGLGYDGIVESFGGWTDGYMSLARSMRLFDGMAGMTETSAIPYASLSKLLTNVLMSAYIEQTGVYQYSTGSGENLLYRLFDVYKISGTLTANAITALNYPVGVGETRVMIENEIFDVRKDLYSELARDIGYSLDCWVMETSSSNYDEIICFENGNTEVEEIFSEDFKSISDGTIKYEVNGRTKTVRLSASCAVIYNGKAMTSPIKGDVFKGKWGNVRLVKPKGKDAETIIINVYESYFVGRIDKKNFTIYDNTANNRSVDFSDENSELSKYAYFANNIGEKISFDDITVNSVLTVAVNEDYFDAIVVSEKVSGVVSSVTEDDGETFVTIDSNQYKIAPEMDMSRISPIKAGSAYTFYLDIGQRIAAGVIGTSDAEAMEWAYLIDINYSEEDDALYFRTLLKSGEVIKLRNADRIKIDGRTYKEADIGTVRALFTTGEDIVKSQVIRLGVNDEGEISVIDTIEFNSANENPMNSMRNVWNGSRELYYKSSPKTFENEFAISGKTIIFKLPEISAASASKGSSDEYGVTTSDVWIGDEKYTLSAYNSDQYSKMAEVVVTTGVGAAVSMDSQNYVTVVTEVKTLNEDNETVVQIKGLQNNSEQKWTLADGAEMISLKTYMSITPDEKANGTESTKIAKGDTIRFDMDMKGKVSNIQLLYDCSEQKFHRPAADASSTNVNNLNNYAKTQLGMAKIYRITDGYIISATDEQLDVDDPQNTYIITNQNNYRVYEVDMTENKVSISSIEALKDWYNFGNEGCSYVLMQNRYTEGRTIVIYKFN